MPKKPHLKKKKPEKIISVVILALLLCSCVTRQACERRFANAWLESRDGEIGAGADINTTASTYTLMLIRDTTIYVQIPGDTVEGEVPSVPLSESSLLESGRLGASQLGVGQLGATQLSVPKTNVSTLNTRLATSTIWLKDGRLHQKLEQKDTTVATKLRGALKTSTTQNKKECTMVNT